MYKALKGEYHICKACGLFNTRIETPVGHHLYCRRCRYLLDKCSHNWLSKCTSYLLCAYVFFYLAYVEPFLILDASGQVQTITILQGVQELVGREQWLLSALMSMCIFLLAFFEIIAISLILISVYLGYKGQWIKQSIKLMTKLRPWNMLEIFLVSIVVASVKLVDIADLSAGFGLYMFFLLVVFLILANQEINYNWLWDWIEPNDYYLSNAYLSNAMDNSQKHSCSGNGYVNDMKVSNHSMHLSMNIHCKHCGAYYCVDSQEQLTVCLRCYSQLSYRTEKSLQKTIALLITAVIFYIPANFKPILHTVALGEYHADTIFSGAIRLFLEGSWFVASVIVIASIIVPVTKITVLSLLVFSIKYGLKISPFRQTQLYHLTEFIGRWSMIDVFVVIVLMLMVQFGLLANIEPGSAVLPFALVVIITMLAAQSFDSRLIWDSHGSSNAKT